jgi:DNA-binding MarR family transcriptional regulator
MKTTTVITHPIIYTAARLEAVADKYVFNPMGTTAASMKILRLLKDHGPLTPRRIVELGGGTKSNVSQRLRHLEKNGFITRKQDVFPEDRRKVIVKMTKKGDRRVNEIQTRLKKAQICLTKNFSKKEISQHVEFLKKINRLIDREEKNLDKIFKPTLYEKK